MTALAALRAARACIQQDRTAFSDCCMNADGTFELDDAEALAEYDAVLAQIDAALAAPQPEPVAYLCPGGCGCTWRDNHDGSMSLLGRNSESCGVCEPLPLSKLISLYDHPPRSYTPLTEAEAGDIWRQPHNYGQPLEFARAIERAVLERLGVEVEK